jgi:hypothetical protein
MLKQLLAAVAALTLAAPLAAQAQEVPSYAAAPQGDQQIQGRIAAFDGGYNLSVTDINGYSDNVQLHDGTIINPTGLELAPGMVVNILGYNDGSVFEANEIDTPYTIDDAVPYYAGHPWDFYGPSIGLTFFFGNTGWWHHPAGYGYGYGAGYRGNDRGAGFNGGVRVSAGFAGRGPLPAPVVHEGGGHGFAGIGAGGSAFAGSPRGGFAGHGTSDAPHFGGGAAHESHAASSSHERR